MNLFDFTYCGNYNRQIQNLARISPEKWSFGQSGDNGILKGYLEKNTFRLYEEGKVWEEKEYVIQGNLCLFCSKCSTGQTEMVSGRILYRLLAFKNKNHGSAAQGCLCGKSFRSGV